MMGVSFFPKQAIPAKGASSFPSAQVFLEIIQSSYLLPLSSSSFLRIVSFF